MTASLDQAILALDHFQGTSLTRSLSAIERSIIGCDVGRIRRFSADRGIDQSLMDSARAIKKVAGQINVVIHAVGIVQSLPSILEPDEVVESTSLGAGNTGRKFDLETNLRIAEYKFIDWQGGSETIRQNSLFKDFLGLAEHRTHKRKFLYVVGTDMPLKFFRGGRALESVLSRQPKILARLQAKYGSKIRAVRDYYELKEDEVRILDVSPCLQDSA